MTFWTKGRQNKKVENLSILLKICNIYNGPCRGNNYKICYWTLITKIIYSFESDVDATGMNSASRFAL